MNQQHKPWTKMMWSSCELMAVDSGFDNDRRCIGPFDFTHWLWFHNVSQRAGVGPYVEPIKVAEYLGSNKSIESIDYQWFSLLGLIVPKYSTILFMKGAAMCKHEMC